MLKNKIVTNKVVLTYSNFFRPRESNNTNFIGTPKYGTTVIISKDDSYTLNQINEAISNIIQESNFSISDNVKLPLKDGDIDYPYNILYNNCIYLHASTSLKPKVVDHALNEIKYRHDEFGAGTIAKVSLEFVPYKYNGKCGVSATLINVQVFPQNKLAELRSRPEDDFIVEAVDEE